MGDSEVNAYHVLKGVCIRGVQQFGGARMVNLDLVSLERSTASLEILDHIGLTFTAIPSNSGLLIKPTYDVPTPVIARNNRGALRMRPARSSGAS